MSTRRTLTLEDLVEIPRSPSNYYYPKSDAGNLLCAVCDDEYLRCLHTPNEMRAHLLNEQNAQAVQSAPPFGRDPLTQVPSLAGDREARKAVPMFDGLIGYFPNACAYVAHVSQKANDQHNPGEPMHWAADKSVGTGNEIVRHLAERGGIDSDGLRHTGKVAWRSFELLERELLNADPTLKPGVNVTGFTRAAEAQVKPETKPERLPDISGYGDK